MPTPTLSAASSSHPVTGSISLGDTSTLPRKQLHFTTYKIEKKARLATKKINTSTTAPIPVRAYSRKKISVLLRPPSHTPHPDQDRSTPPTCRGQYALSPRQDLRLPDPSTRYTQNSAAGTCLGPHPAYGESGQAILSQDGERRTE